MRSKENLVGAWAVLIGLILAGVIGVFQSWLTIEYLNWISAMLMVIGLVVGFLITGSKESNIFLLAAVSLVVVSYMGKGTLIGSVGTLLRAILDSFLTMLVPATVIVAIKSVFSISRI